jgi:hypothetical protein
MTSHVERHIHALELAKQCVALGANIRTTNHLTNLTHGQLTDLFFSDNVKPPRGRPPESPDWWYHATNLVNQTEASIFVSIFRRIRELGFGPADALVAGYKHYLSVCHTDPRISFDRAFDLASNMDGLWTVRAPSFSLATCPVCTSQYVTTLSAPSAKPDECPFCKLVTRYRRDPRIQKSFPVTALPDLSTLQLGIAALSKHKTKS